jgi:hypothetical protein
MRDEPLHQIDHAFFFSLRDLTRFSQF